MNNLKLLFHTAAYGWLLLCVTTTFAQVPKKPHHTSFSNSTIEKHQKSAGERFLSDVAAEPSTTNAILAQTMRDLYVQTDAHFEKGEYNHTINLNRIVAQGDPHNMDTYADSAWLLWSTDRPTEAVTFLKQGIAANPNTYYLYDEMGELYWLDLKEPVKAIPYYQKAVQFDCPFFTWNSLAHCYEKTGQMENAVATWKKASRYASNVVAQINLKRVEKSMAAHKSGKQ